MCIYCIEYYIIKLRLRNEESSENLRKFVDLTLLLYCFCMFRIALLGVAQARDINYTSLGIIQMHFTSILRRREINTT